MLFFWLDRRLGGLYFWKLTTFWPNWPNELTLRLGYAKMAKECGHGGIGRRARFRFLWAFGSCRFKSCCPHQSLKKRTLWGSFFFSLPWQRTCDNASRIVGKLRLQPALVQLTRRKSSKLVCLLLRSLRSLQVLLSAPKPKKTNLMGFVFLFFALTTDLRQCKLHCRQTPFATYTCAADRKRRETQAQSICGHRAQRT